ncbi:MAG: hypothetical protein ACR2K1_13830, partial [Saprospiraceae bacterium]
VTGGVKKLLQFSFGGGKAEGGPLQQNKWYIAGEKGPEPIWGGGAGAFAAGYGGSGSSATVINIDARGATNPAEIDQRVRQGLSQAFPAFLDAARRSTRDDFSRRVYR